MSTEQEHGGDRRAAKQLGVVTLGWLVFVFGISLLLILLLP
jgi:hypothetical protein